MWMKDDMLWHAMLGIAVWDNTFHCRERDIVLRISITIMQTVQMRVGVWLSAQCSDRGVSGLLHFLLLVTHTINTAIPVSVSTCLWRLFVWTSLCPFKVQSMFAQRTEPYMSYRALDLDSVDDPVIIYYGTFALHFQFAILCYWYRVGYV